MIFEKVPGNDRRMLGECPETARGMPGECYLYLHMCVHMCAYVPDFDPNRTHNVPPGKPPTKPTDFTKDNFWTGWSLLEMQGPRE